MASPPFDPLIARGLDALAARIRDYERNPGVDYSRTRDYSVTEVREWSPDAWRQLQRRHEDDSGHRPLPVWDAILPATSPTTAHLTRALDHADRRARLRTLRRAKRSTRNAQNQSGA